MAGLGDQPAPAPVSIQSVPVKSWQAPQYP